MAQASYLSLHRAIERGFIRLYNLIATISENTRSFAALINSDNGVSHMNRTVAGLFFGLDSSGADYHQRK
ncbi:hypothetical protein Desku_0632 [Desulfofundulus kuznetsovii DSM 6115]|uniref:Uncharacterized protein n=1 Tax=Desulfofundulus kuznetsovii (strain DSM 6115 / VKM B-1805 / 17) TaxID=760568 RepID=A0AAU8PWU8_DESK7|nr:hypothetical protein Desku_0632 [Desulfofundulus kuznetsovii DSM 6115]